MSCWVCDLLLILSFRVPRYITFSALLWLLCQHARHPEHDQALIGYCLFSLSLSSYEASLIRGNRANCALFCDNLDWLVSKLDRLEASSGKVPFQNLYHPFQIDFNVFWVNRQCFIVYYLHRRHPGGAILCSD